MLSDIIYLLKIVSITSLFLGGTSGVFKKNLGHHRYFVES